MHVLPSEGPMCSFSPASGMVRRNYAGGQGGRGWGGGVWGGGGGGRCIVPLSHLHQEWYNTTWPCKGLKLAVCIGLQCTCMSWLMTWYLASSHICFPSLLVNMHCRCPCMHAFNNASAAPQESPGPCIVSSIAIAVSTASSKGIRLHGTKPMSLPPAACPR